MSLSSMSGGGTISMEDLRAETETKLVALQIAMPMRNDGGESEGWDSTMDSDAMCSLPCVLRVFLFIYGVVSFRAGRLASAHKFFVLLLIAGAFLYHSILAWAEPTYFANASMAWFAFGACVAGICLCVYRIQDLIGPDCRPLENYAYRRGFLRLWRNRSAREACLMLGLWACAIAIRIGVVFSPRCLEEEDVHTMGASIASFVFTSGMSTALMLCQLHICCGLGLAVDMYCHSFFASQDLGSGLQDWNMLQAMLRRSARKVEVCFLALCTSNVMVALIAGVEVYQHGMVIAGPSTSMCAVLRLGWVLVIVAQTLHVVFSAAGVTEKCTRVPSLVNSWSFGEETCLDAGRQYVVQYIEQSAAGFYVKGVRLRAYMALKISYLFGALLFTLLSSSVRWSVTAAEM